MFFPRLGNPLGLQVNLDMAQGMLAGVIFGDRNEYDMVSDDFLTQDMKYLDKLKGLSKVKHRLPYWRFRRARPLINAVKQLEEDEKLLEEERRHLLNDRGFDWTLLASFTKHARIYTILANDYDDIRDVEELGQSDITATTLAMMRMLAKGEGIDMRALMMEHVNALTRCKKEGNLVNWSTTGSRSIIRMAKSQCVLAGELMERATLESQRTETALNAHITYFTSGNEHSYSDTFIPKLACVALYHASRPTTEYSLGRRQWDLERIISMTNRNSISIVCGIIYSTFLEMVMRSESDDVLDLAGKSLIAMQLYSYCVFLENSHGEHTYCLSLRLTWLIDNAHCTDLETLAKLCNHPTYQCVNSVVWVIGLFLVCVMSPEWIGLSFEHRINARAQVSAVGATLGCIGGISETTRPSYALFSDSSDFVNQCTLYHNGLHQRTAHTLHDIAPGARIPIVEEDSNPIWAPPHRQLNEHLKEQAIDKKPKWRRIAAAVGDTLRLIQFPRLMKAIADPASNIHAFVISLFLGYGVFYLYQGSSQLVQRGKALTDMTSEEL